MSIIKRVGIAVALLVSAIVGVTGIAPVLPTSIAGAVDPIVPCGTGNGWFGSYPPPTQMGGYAALNCSRQGNHIVVDVWNGPYRSQGVVDMWYDPAYFPTFGNDANGTFFIRFDTAYTTRPWWNMNEMPQAFVGCCTGGSYHMELIKLHGITVDTYERIHFARLTGWNQGSGTVTWDNPNTNPFGFVDYRPRGTNNNPYFRSGGKTYSKAIAPSGYLTSFSQVLLWRSTGG